MTIQIVGSVPLNMVIFYRYVYTLLPEGKPPFSHGFPMIFPFTTGFTITCFPMIFHGFSEGFPISRGLNGVWGWSWAILPAQWRQVERPRGGPVDQVLAGPAECPVMFAGDPSSLCEYITLYDDI